MIEHRVLKDASGVYVQYRHVLLGGRIRLWWSYYQQGIPEYTTPRTFSSVREAVASLGEFIRKGEQIQVIETTTITA